MERRGKRAIAPAPATLAAERAHAGGPASRQSVSGERYNAHTLKSGKVVQVFALYGLQLALDYTLEGWFRKRMIIVIEEIRPTDLLPLDDYEERKRRYYGILPR